jgi:hypothetical protein
VGKPTVRFSGLVGYENPDILYQPVQGWQNAMLRNEANMNIGSAPAFTPQKIRDLYDHQDEEYWYFNEIMVKGLKQNYNMSVSGETRVQPIWFPWDTWIRKAILPATSVCNVTISVRT